MQVPALGPGPLCVSSSALALEDGQRTGPERSRDLGLPKSCQAEPAPRVDRPRPRRGENPRTPVHSASRYSAPWLGVARWSGFGQWIGGYPVRTSRSIAARIPSTTWPQQVLPTKRSFPPASVASCPRRLTPPQTGMAWSLPAIPVRQPEQLLHEADDKTPYGSADWSVLSMRVSIQDRMTGGNMP